MCSLALQSLFVCLCDARVTTAGGSSGGGVEHPGVYGSWSGGGVEHPSVYGTAVSVMLHCEELSL